MRNLRPRKSSYWASRNGRVLWLWILPAARIRSNYQMRHCQAGYRWRWHTRIHSGDNPQAIKANFEQSTNLDITLESAVLHESVLNFRPSRGEAGEIDHFILGMMDGRNTIDQIASQAQEKYPLRFETQREAQFYINVLSQEFGR